MAIQPWLAPPFHTVGSNSLQGAAYVFTATEGSWSQQAELTAGDGAFNAQFGNAVSLSGDGSTALIGSVNKKVGSHTSQGTAYIFTSSAGTWSQQAELTASDGVSGDNFGYAVALSNDGSTVLIGAFNKAVNGNSGQGAAYVFTANGGGWSQQAELTASDGAAGDQFGNSVALTGSG